MRVVVTGCSRGIGRATAALLADRGHEVVATARDPDTLTGLEVAERRRLDIDSAASVSETFESIGPVDVVVNNAAIGVRGPIEAVPLDEVERMFGTNVFGTVRVMQAVLPGMRERGSGTLVNVTSLGAHVALPLHGFYCATKYAVQAITEAARIELGHFGVRVLAVAPGFVDSGWVNIEHGLDSPPYDELERQMQGSSAIDDLNGGLSKPEAIAEVIVDAIESDDDAFFWPAGDDAHMIIGAREQLGYAGFEKALRDTMSLDW